MTTKKMMICPYCGQTQAQAERCRACGGLFEPLSRQATHNAMGPWFIRDPARPFRPGCSYETLAKMIDRGQVNGTTILRGPTTRQFWTVARRVPGVAHLLGYCHNCDAHVAPADHGCHACGVPFGAFLDRENLGLPEVRPLPWEAELDEPAPGLGGAPVDGAGAGFVAGGRLSRFASDDELLGRRAASFSPATFADPVASGAAAGAEQAASEILARALRRRVSTQRRTIQLLALLLVAATGLLVLLSVGRSGAGTQRQATPAAQAGAPATVPPAAVAPARAEPMEAVEHAPAQPDAPPAQSTVEQGAATTPLRDGIMALVAAASQEDRPIDERIADYERALDGLNGVATVPEDLAETLGRIKRDLERLKLKRDFFGL